MIERICLIYRHFLSLSRFNPPSAAICEPACPEAPATAFVAHFILQICRLVTLPQRLVATSKAITDRAIAEQLMIGAMHASTALALQLQ